MADSIMVDVLVDLHLRDARLALFKDVPDGLRDSLLLHHGITEAAFQRAKAYYADHPEEYLQLYGAVLDRLSAEARPPNAGEDLSPDTTTAETTTVTKRLLQRVE